MKVAVPIHNGRVSPTFDWALTMMVVEFVGNQRQGAVESSLEGMSPPERVERARELGVEVLLCGGISTVLATLAEGADIRVVPWVAGDVDEVLEAFANNRLMHSRFAMPGCRGRMGARLCRRGRIHRRRKGRGHRGRAGGSS